MSSATAIYSALAMAAGYIIGFFYFNWLIVNDYKKAQFWSIVVYVILLVGVLAFAVYHTFQHQGGEAEGPKPTVIGRAIEYYKPHAEQPLTYPSLALGDIRLKGHSGFISGDNYFASIWRQGVEQDSRIPQVALMRPFFVSHLSPDFRVSGKDCRA